MLGSIGFPEILMILVIALLIFGPKKLPEVGRTIGKGLAEFRRASSDLKRSVNAELALDDDERQPTSRRPAAASRTLGDGARSDPGPGPDETAAPAPTVTEAPENTAARGSLESSQQEQEKASAPAGEAVEAAQGEERTAAVTAAAKAPAPAPEAAEPAPAEDPVATH